MGQILHACARTTETIRRAIQNSQESVRTFATKYGANPKTIAKWKKRDTVGDLSMGPKEVRSSVLTKEQEALIVAFRKHTLLPLDDCFYALKESIPCLTRSSLHRCLQRHGINRLQDVSGEKKPKKKFKSYPIGFFHIDIIDIAEVRTEERKRQLFVAIDRTSKFVMANLCKRATTESAKAFLETSISAVPYRIHTVLTDNGIQFADLPKYRDGMTAQLRGHPFARVCRQNGIEHRLTQPNHPGQIERMNRTLKEATEKRYYYESQSQLEEHLDAFIAAYHFARRLKTLKGLTPYEFIVKTWAEDPQRFHHKPTHFNMGLHFMSATPRGAFLQPCA